MHLLSEFSLFSHVRYKRKGDSCLGLNPKKQRISWEGASTEKKRSHRHAERYFAKKNVSLMNVDGVAVSGQTEPLPPEPVPFIPVKGLDDVGPPVTTWLNPLGIYDQSTTQWLQGQGPSEQESKQPDSQPDPESALLKAKVEEFNRKVRENPRDIPLWMAFVAFQVSTAVLVPYLAEHGRPHSGPPSSLLRGTLALSTVKIIRASPLP